MCLRRGIAALGISRPEPFPNFQSIAYLRLKVTPGVGTERGVPSARSWARQLGISHVWLLKVVRGLKENPSEVRRLQAYGDPKFAELLHARECTREMKERGELRLHCKRKPLS